MRISRRALGTLAGGVVLGLVAGCGGKSPARASADRLEWLRGLDGVEKAELLAPDDNQIRLTLAGRLPDHDIKALVEKIKQEFRPHGDGYSNTIEVAIDGYHGQFSPSAYAKDDPDLERALWLRRDGRATSSAYGTSGLIVIAPPTAVAAVALGFDQVVPSEDARRTHRVESADLQVIVEWTDSPKLGLRLDRAATQYFADLQAKYPNLTGWIEGPERRAGVYFAATDVELDAVPKLVANRFGELTLGWGPVRAPHAVFATGLTPQVRILIGHLMKIPGVTGIEIDDDAEVASVTVKDRAGYVAADSTLRKVGDYLPIQLIRGPSRRVGQPGNVVFRTSAWDKDREFRIYAAIADLAGVTAVQIGPEFASLTILPDITDPDLATALKAMAQLPPPTPIRLFVSDGPDDVGVTPIGTITNRKYVPKQPTPSNIDPALISRLTTTWTHTTR